MSPRKRRSRNTASSMKTRTQAILRPPRNMILATIDTTGCAAIFEGVLRVLWEIGMQVDDKQATEMFVSKGCKASDGRVYFPPDVVKRALETVPDTITFYGYP